MGKFQVGPQANSLHEGWIDVDSTEQHRHRAEVRHYLAKERKNGEAWFRDFTTTFKRWPGSALQKDFNEQRKAGNTGRPGEWVETIKGVTA